MFVRPALEWIFKRIVWVVKVQDAVLSQSLFHCSSVRRRGTADNAPVFSFLFSIYRFAKRYQFVCLFCCLVFSCECVCEYLAVLLSVFWLPALCAAPAVTDGEQPTPRLTGPY